MAPRDLGTAVVGVAADLGYAWRQARKRPGFAAAVVLTLGLGIGANTAVFSLIHAVVLSPLPYHEPDDLYSVSERHESGRLRVPSYPTYLDWTQEAGRFEESAFVRGAAVTYRSGDQSGLMVGAFVTKGFFSLLGMAPELGRFLSNEDSRPGAESAVVLSHRAWQQWFGADPDILGTTLVVDQVAFAVVGVMPPSFAYPDWGADNDLWMPLSHLPEDQLAALNQRGFSADSRVVARLGGGRDVAEVQQRLDRLEKSLSDAYPDVSAGWNTVHFDSLKELEIGGVRPRLLVLWAAVVLLLLMCCLNLANLYLVQGSSRRREYAVRAALGAPRGRVFRQVLTETLALAAIGGGVGVLLAQQGIAWARTGGLTDLPRIAELRLDGTVLLFAALLAVATAVFFALLSARHAGGAALQDHLRGRGPGLRWMTPLLSGIQAAQVGMTFVLLMGAWLLGETFVNLTRVDPGYDPADVVVVPINPPSPRYDSGAAASDLYTRLLDAVRAVPGVTSVALTNHGPGGLDGLQMAAAIGGAPQGADDDLSVYYRTVSAGYFATVATPVVAGREFTDQDLAGGEGPLIVNETLAGRFGGPAAAVGQTLGVDKAASTRPDFGEALLGTIVGVVGDLDDSETGGRPVSVVYVPFTQSPWAQVRLLVRARGTSAAMLRTIEAAVHTVEPAIPLSGPFSNVGRLEDLRFAQRSQERLSAGLTSAFAGVALLLACIGMYGVISFIVLARRREVGVRIALGATSTMVTWQVVRRAALISAAGLGVGAVVSALSTSLITSMLFRITPLDAGRYVVVAALLLLIAVAAALLPARRAAMTDPAVVLRSE